MSIDLFTLVVVVVRLPAVIVPSRSLVDIVYNMTWSTHFQVTILESFALVIFIELKSYDGHMQSFSSLRELLDLPVLLYFLLPNQWEKCNFFHFPNV